MHTTLDPVSITLPSLSVKHELTSTTGLGEAVDKHSTPLLTRWKNIHAVKHVAPLTFNHVPFVVAVIVTVRGPVVNVEALDRSVVVSRGTILDGDGKKIMLDYSNLVSNYHTKRGNFPAPNSGPCYQQMYKTAS